MISKEQEIAKLCGLISHAAERGDTFAIEILYTRLRSLTDFSTACTIYKTLEQEDKNED